MSFVHLTASTGTRVVVETSPWKKYFKYFLGGFCSQESNLYRNVNSISLAKESPKNAWKCIFMKCFHFAHLADGWGGQSSICLGQEQPVLEILWWEIFVGTRDEIFVQKQGRNICRKQRPSQQGVDQGSTEVHCQNSISSKMSQNCKFQHINSA